MAGSVVAYLEVQRADGDEHDGEYLFPRSTDHLINTLPGPEIIQIHGNEQFYLGRNTELW
jgi:hypothetical protein